MALIYRLTRAKCVFPAENKTVNHPKWTLLCYFFLFFFFFSFTLGEGFTVSVEDFGCVPLSFTPLSFTVLSHYHSSRSMWSKGVEFTSGAKGERGGVKKTRTSLLASPSSKSTFCVEEITLS